jgi:WD40 repeat protein
MKFKLSILWLLILVAWLVEDMANPNGQTAVPIQVPCPPTAPESFCVLSGHSSFVYTVAFSPDSKLLASGSCVSSGSLRCARLERSDSGK